MRYVQLEFAKQRDVPRLQASSVFVTAIAEDDIDNYVPNHLPLAIHELDGKFTTLCTTLTSHSKILFV